MLREVDRALEIDDDLLGSFLPDSRDRSKELIIFELDRFQESFSSEPQKTQCGLSSYSIHTEKLSKERLLTLIDEAKERLTDIGHMVVKPDIRLLSYANIRYKKW